MNTKMRLLALGKTQVNLLTEIRHRGYPRITPSQISKYISGLDVSPQAVAVMKIADDILTEWEQERKMANG